MDVIHVFPSRDRLSENVQRHLQKQGFSVVDGTCIPSSLKDVCCCLFFPEADESNYIVEQSRLLDNCYSLFILDDASKQNEACIKQFPTRDVLFPPYADSDILLALNRLKTLHTHRLEEKNLLNDLSVKKKMIRVYHDLTRTLTSTLSINEIVQKVRQKCARLLQCEFLSVYLFNKERDILAYCSGGKRRRKKPQTETVDFSSTLPGIVFHSGKPMLLNFAEGDDTSLEADHYPFSINSLCLVPLNIKGSTLGVFEAVNKKDAAGFVQEDMLLLQILADHAAIAIDNAMLYERVRTLTVIDDLTQVYNYRFFNTMLVNEFKRAKRFLSPLSLLFLDLDGFKRVNDQYGHQVGSNVLRDIASIIKSNVRVIDIVSRFGGDEFTIILPNTGSEGATQVAKRIQENIEAYRYPGISDWDIQLSASVGIASFPEHVQTKDQMLKMADMAMYSIKENRKRDLTIGTLSSPVKEDKGQ